MMEMAKTYSDLKRNEICQNLTKFIFHDKTFFYRNKNQTENDMKLGHIS